jgi:hypothetical protein
LNRSAWTLIQAGFNSRLAAIKVITDTGATFWTSRELRQWLNSDTLAAWSALADWPTAETKAMWTEFVQSFTPRENRTWADRRYWANVAWTVPTPWPGTPVHFHQWNDQAFVLSADGTPLGTMQASMNPAKAGLVRGQVSQDGGTVDLIYLGPDDLFNV